MCRQMTNSFVATRSRRHLLRGLESNCVRQRGELISAARPARMETHFDVTSARLVLEGDGRGYERRGRALRDPIADVSVSEDEFLVGHNFQISTRAGPLETVWARRNDAT